MQVHGKDGDPFFTEDIEAAHDLVDSTDRAELFLYPGEEHLFADSSLPVPAASASQRVCSSATSSSILART